MYPQDGGPLKVCRKCDPQHAANCSECFGWGLLASATEPCGFVPISGERVDEWRACTLGREPIRCSVCGGHPAGRISPPGVVEVDATDDDTRIG